MFDDNAMLAEMVKITEEASLFGPWRIRPLRWLLTATIEFKKQDAWVGAFWKRTPFDREGWDAWDVWVCLIPCFPVHVWWYRKR